MKLITLNVSFGLVVKLIQFGKKLADYAYLKFDKLIKLKLKDVLFGYKEKENSGDVLAINHVILIEKCVLVNTDMVNILIYSFYLKEN